MFISERIGYWLARYLSKPRDEAVNIATSRPELLRKTLRKGDVLLVEGTSRISTTIKYLTQSTWLHAALYIGKEEAASIHSASASADYSGELPVLIEADVLEGVRVVPLSMYSHLHTRICRPVGLSAEEVDEVVRFARSRIGQHYDLKNIFDLARYLVTVPPIPTYWRRYFLQLGSGDPTKAICSSLIAQAFQSMNYPILPRVSKITWQDKRGRVRTEEVLHRRDPSLYVPRDFDVSPYFRVVKPAIEQGFDPHNLTWARSEQGDRPLPEFDLEN